MAQKSRPTFQKREKEKARAQKKVEKMQRRLEAKERRAGAQPVTEDVDPDIAGIVPGPQPLPEEWRDILDEKEGQGEEESEEE